MLTNPTAARLSSRGHQQMQSDESNPYDVDPTRVYNGMVPHERREVNPIDRMIDLRDGIDSLAENRSSFKLKDVLDEEHPYNTVTREMVGLCGSWVMPNCLYGYRGTRYVNPNDSGRWVNSDVFTECECGATVISATGERDVDSAVPARTTHGDDCRTIWRIRATHELYENRREAIVRQLHLDQTTRDACKRVGLPNSHTVHYAHNVNADLHRAIGRTMVAHTAVMNLHRRSKTKVAEALGYTTEGLERVIDEHYDDDVDYGELYELRKQNGTADLGNLNVPEA